MVRIYYVLFILISCAVYSSAQDERVLPKNAGSSLQGTSFVVGFMQNELVERGYTPRLQLFISSLYDAQVSIEYPGFGYATRTIAKNTIYVENVGSQLMSSISEYVDQKSIFIKSNVPIVVYVLNTLAASTDSYCAIPIKHLGKNYLTFNRQNDRYGLSERKDVTDTMARGSEFMVMAVEDGTNLDITPTQLTERGFSPTRPISITLNRGDTYLVKSSNARFQNGDLTGSKIVTSKPVGVLSGHVRAGIPSGPNQSKDHLVEMLTPTEKWGNTFVSTPFANAGAYDIVRLLVAEDDTWIDVETNTGVTRQYFAKAGNYRDFNTSKATKYKSDKKFAVGQYMYSSTSNSLGNLICDPALVILPATSQFVNSALFQFPALESQNINGQLYFYYVNIVADSVALKTLKLNNTLVSDMAPAILSQRVPGTKLYWVQLSLPRAVYFISSDTGTFSGIMYGTSNYDSYANLFGMSFEPPSLSDETPPRYNLKYACGTVSGLIQDYSNNEVPYLSDVTIQLDDTYNFTWTLSGLLDTVGSRFIDAAVKDLTRDAQLVIHSYDNKGNGREWKVYYDAPAYVSTPSVEFPIQIDKEVCSFVVLRNVDKTPLTIERVLYAGAGEFYIKNLPVSTVTLKPGDSLALEVCYLAGKTPKYVKGSIQFHFRCGLTHTVAVENALTPLVSVTDVDFGNVRIGDTACGVVNITSTGTVTAFIEQLLMTSEYQSEFVYDTSGLQLPAELKPGESINVPVCFMPKLQQLYTRTDTLISRFSSLPFSLKGRGVRPVISDVTIDWGSRRVGVPTDTIALIWNTGDIGCVVNCITPLASNPSFKQPQFCGGGVTIDVNRAVTSTFTFTPDRVGPIEWRIPLEVDWRFHDTVWVTLRGEGTLPRLTTRTIDMGMVIINTTKDSVVEVLSLAGNESLDIVSITEIGPDNAQLKSPEQLLATTKLEVGESVSGLVQFTPDRLGMFYSEVEVRHLGAPNFKSVVDKVIFIGQGVPADTVKIGSALKADAVVEACVENTARVELSNLGNIPLVINQISATFNGITKQVLNSPQSVSVNGSNAFEFNFIADRTTDRTVFVEILYSDSMVEKLQHTFEVRYAKPSIQVGYPAVVGAGEPVEIDLRISQSMYQEVPVSLDLMISIDPLRFELINNSVEVRVSDADLSNQVRSGTLRQVDGRVNFLLDGLLRAPYNVEFSVSGTSLWKTPDPTKFYVSKSITNCEDEASADGVLNVLICAGGLRVINFGSLALVTGVMTNNVVDDRFEIDLNASKNTDISIRASSIEGDQFEVVKKYSLQKGSQRCNFSCSGWSSGLYLLEIRHDTGVIHASFLIVH